MRLLKCFAVLAGMLAGTLLFGQSRETYCTLSYCAYDTGFITSSIKVVLNADFGAFKVDFNDEKSEDCLVDEQGKPILFDSLLKAANFLAERGWVFKQAYMFRPSSTAQEYSWIHWVMAKTITNPSEISEGFCTARMME